MARSRIYLSILCASFGFFSLSAAVSAGVSYSISEISGEAIAITDNGYILSGTALQNPDGTLISPPADSTNSIEGRAVNGSGIVVGTVSGVSPGVWQGSSVFALPTLPIGADAYGQADSINVNGVIVGWEGAGQVLSGTTVIQPKQLRAVSWTNGVPQDPGAYLGNAANGSFATAINNGGSVLINSFPEGVVSSLPSCQSYLLRGNVLTPVSSNDGSSIGISSWAINDAGEVAGTIFLGDGSYHVFTWFNGHMNIAPLLSSMLPGADGAMAINSNGEVVGISQSATGPVGFVWDGQNAPVDLNDLIGPNSGWLLTSRLGSQCHRRYRRKWLV